MTWSKITNLWKMFRLCLLQAQSDWTLLFELLRTGITVLHYLSWLILVFPNLQRVFLVNWLAWENLIFLWLLPSSKVSLVFQSYIGIYSWLFLFHFLDLFKFPLLNVQTRTLPPFLLRCHRHSNSNAKLKYPYFQMRRWRGVCSLPWLQ